MNSFCIEGFDDRTILSRKEAAQILNISPQTFDRHIAGKKIRKIYIGRRIGFAKEEIEDLISGNAHIEDSFPFSLNSSLKTKISINYYGDIEELKTKAYKAIDNLIENLQEKSLDDSITLAHISGILEIESLSNKEDSEKK